MGVQTKCDIFTRTKQASAKKEMNHKPTKDDEEMVVLTQ